MLELLEEILINKVGNWDAVNSVNEEFCPELQYSSQLHFVQLER